MSLAVELHNTLRMGGGSAGRRARGREPARPPRAVRAALHAVVAGDVPDRDTLDALNAAAARAPASPAVRSTAREARSDDRLPRGNPSRHRVASIAADAIDLIAGPRADELRACGAPGCVLLFEKDHPRRAWCSDACGNRARQARHYARRHS